MEFWSLVGECWRLKTGVFFFLEESLDCCRVPCRYFYASFISLRKFPSGSLSPSIINFYSLPYNAKCVFFSSQLSLAYNSAF